MKLVECLSAVLGRREKGSDWNRGLDRAKPAVPFGGGIASSSFTLSNVSTAAFRGCSFLTAI